MVNDPPIVPVTQAFDYVGTDDPTTGTTNVETGEMWYDTSTDTASVYDGTAWVEISVVDHSQLSGVNTSDHHAKTSSASELSDVPPAPFDTSDLSDDAITAAKIAAQAVDEGKIDPSNATSGEAIKYDGTNVTWGSAGVTDHQNLTNVKPGQHLTVDIGNYVGNEDGSGDVQNISHNLGTTPTAVIIAGQRGADTVFAVGFHADELNDVWEYSGVHGGSGFSTDVSETLPDNSTFPVKDYTVNGDGDDYIFMAFA